MDKPTIKHVSQIAPDQSVVVIFTGDSLPLQIELSKVERLYAEKRFNEGDNVVFINSYFKCFYLVKTVTDQALFQVREKLRQSATQLANTIKENRHKELVVTSVGAYNGAIEDFVEAFLLKVYSFDKYITTKKDNNLPAELLLCGNVSEENIKWLTTVTDAAYKVRDLINEPVCVMNAKKLSEEIKALGSRSGFSVDVLQGKQIEALQMGGLMAVNKGSVDQAVFCILEYTPAESINSRPVVLVGKGIVYDTGGLNIKTGTHMDGMHGDMAGAATVAGVMSVIAENKLPIRVVGLIPITDNRPGGNAYAQGDIITMFNKKTVEIGNTDAEGRLILADAISYASKFNPDLIVDIATLTGSAARTFGNQAIAVMSNADRRYVKLLEKCGEDVYERVAELPLWEEYGEQIKSRVADLSNTGKGGYAGAITAGKFLEAFAEAPLIHLDIAGTGMLDKDDYYRLKQFPGSGLRLLLEFIKRLAKNYIE